MNIRDFKNVYIELEKWGVQFTGKRAQFPAEFSEYATWVQEFVKPRRYLEIGSRHGESLALHASIMQPGSFLTSVELALDDDPDVGWGRPGSKANLEKVVKALNVDHFVDVIYGNSQDSSIIRTIEARAPFDLIFIDGDHSYEGARLDWFNYKDLGQYIAFHDAGSIHEVSKVWREIKAQYSGQNQMIEFIKNQGDKTMGIGVFKNV